MNDGKRFHRRSFLKTLGAGALVAPFITRNLFAKPSGDVLRHASIGVGGMGATDLTEFTNNPKLKLVAFCDVDAKQIEKVLKKFPDARAYKDWRILLDKESGNIDSINVATPDHMHAPIAVTAMEMGKNVYCQKPLAHDIHEVRRMAEIASKNHVVTQMGIQIHSSAAYRTGVAALQSGAIGKIKEVHTWCPKSWGDATPKPDRQDAVPEGFEWDLWLGVCAERPFIGEGYYHPANWRKRLDFGTGTFGDMGCHIFDPVFKSLELAAPISVRSEGPAPNEWNWALDSKIIYSYAGTKYTADKTLSVTWYDGASTLPKSVIDMLEGDKLPRTGSVFIGTEGVMVLPHVAKPQFYPDAKFKDYKYPEATEVSHWGSFINASLGHESTSANFAYAGPLTEAVLLGGVASRFPTKTLEWNPQKMEFNIKEANQFISRTYRKGWEIKSLA